MLIGLVTKNGILIVEFANQQRKAGMNKLELLYMRLTMRLRPILMTSLAMSLGALPLPYLSVMRHTSRIPLGIVIVGGIMFSPNTYFICCACYVCIIFHPQNDQ